MPLQTNHNVDQLTLREIFQPRHVAPSACLFSEGQQIGFRAFKTRGLHGFGFEPFFMQIGGNFPRRVHDAAGIGTMRPHLPSYIIFRERLKMGDGGFKVAPRVAIQSG